MSNDSSSSVPLNAEQGKILSLQIARLLEVLDQPATQDEDPIAQVLHFLDLWVDQATRQSELMQILNAKLDAILDINAISR
ncbi:hypothetical protein [Tardiphaga robiniae]|uniref:Uncharacterized protein n=1 Tax=Tardiphaga robiniae TaxID=943830 RepID=A0A7G6TYZ1_9BRAD|nr:hypothetical protein [Tardiphaga robiniae]QND71973.1 hypothetical protein HB776_12600 [Tardiphaga robiniae]